MLFNRILYSFNSIWTGPIYRSHWVTVRTFDVNKKESDSKPPCEHVGENPLNPQCNCWKYSDCPCTPLHECAETNQYQGISKRKRRRKKSDSDSVVSDEEKSLLKQFRRRAKMGITIRGLWTDLENDYQLYSNLKTSYT